MIAYWCIWSILYRLVSVHFKPIYRISFNICIYLQVVTTYNLTFLLLVFHGFPLKLRHAVVSCCINQHNVSHCAWGVLQVPVTCQCTAFTCFGIAMCMHSLFAFSCLLPLPEVLLDAHNIWFPRQMICKTAIPKAQSCSCKNLRVNGRQEAPTLCFCATLWPFQRREALRFTRGGETKKWELANLLAHLFAWRCNSWMLEATCTASNGSNFDQTKV
jgi:hypothetical protein